MQPDNRIKRKPALQAFFLHMRAYIFIFAVCNVNLHKKELPTTSALVIP